MNIENFVSIATFRSEVEAQLAQATLSAAHIESFIHSDDAGGMLPMLENTEGVQLLVDQTLAVEAKSILATSPTAAPDVAPDDFNPESPGTA